MYVWGKVRSATKGEGETDGGLGFTNRYIHIQYTRTRTVLELAVLHHLLQLLRLPLRAPLVGLDRRRVLPLARLPLQYELARLRVVAVEKNHTGGLLPVPARPERYVVV